VSDERKAYGAEDIMVYFYPSRCNHVRECVNGLPEVFNTESNPWVCPENADAQVIAETIERCPTGALQYQRLDGGEDEEGSGHTLISAQPNGPFFVNGEIEIRDESGEAVAKNTRVALCRCGYSDNQPFCDGSHKNLHH
jgi:uncharacterized Fe-S cluster protein YjdI